MTHADVIVVGGGIAGVSAASELASSSRVVLVEAEAQTGYHATGRSAAFFAPTYGNAVIRALTKASEALFSCPPDIFGELELMKRRSWITIARADQREKLEADRATLVDCVEVMDVEDVVAEVPIVDREYIAAAYVNRRGGDLDVDAILQGYLKTFRRRGGEVRCGTRVSGMEHRQGQWHVATTAGEIVAPIVVNAAGAWADETAALARLKPLGIQPLRRTAILVAAPDGNDVSAWPVVVDVDEEFYFKPEAGAILISPADETPSLPCDAQPEELDVAIAVDRFERATSMTVRRVTHKWAGLRTFARDRTPVVGFDPRAEGFFWLAGQGGYGVQTAPAMARLAAALLTGSAPPLEDGAMIAEATKPERLL